MQIAIIGAGNVGGTLGRRWSAGEHVVTFGIRTGGEVRGGLPAGARSDGIAAAVADAEVVVLATPWGAVDEAIGAAGSLAGKILFDCTNPIGPGFRLERGPNGESGGERVAMLAAGARVVKVFNTTGVQNLEDPVYDGSGTSMFIAGDDAPAKAVAAALSRELGFEPVDAGALVRARELEHLAMLWIGLSMSGLGRHIAFRLVRR